MVTFKAGTKYSGTVCAGPSKSHMIRVIMCAFLRRGVTEITFSGELPKDVICVIEAVKALGAKVTVTENTVYLDSSGEIKERGGSVNLGECGTGYAFFRVLSQFPGWSIDVGRSGTLEKRDYGFADVEFDGCGNVIVDGSISSQGVSGAMIAATFCREKKYNIIIKGKMASPGYVQMTADVLRLFDKTGPISVCAEPDFSAIAVFKAANYLGCDFTFPPFKGYSLQPDFSAESLFGSLSPDVNKNPDTAALLAVIAANRTKKTVISGTGRLKNKESDRQNGTAELINALGGKAVVSGDKIEIFGTGGLKGGQVQAKDDHRVVFAAFLASLISKTDVTVDGAEEAVKKSCPDFFEILKAAEVQSDEI